MKRTNRAPWSERVLRCFLGIAFFYVQIPATYAETAEESSAVETERYLPGRLTLGVRGGNDEVEGLGDILIPLMYQNGGLLFFNPRVGVNDDSEQEVQLGLGYRYLFPEKNVIVGANIFYDSRWSRHDNRYDQLGFGVELLTRHLDARANYYLPERTKNVVDRFEQSTVTRSSSTSVSAPFPEVHSFKETITTTTRTTTHRETFEHFETTAEGWDVEAGVWLPFKEDYPLQVGLFAGWYHFDPHYGIEKVEGWRGRAEIRILPSLILDAELYENDNLTGTDYFIGGRVQVPFDLAALANGRNPFAGAREGFQPGSRPFAYRLTENVIRDPNIRMGEDIEKTGEETTTESRTSSRKEIVLDDVNFVNNANASGGDGTAENPYPVVQEGVDNAFGQKNVYVFAGNGPYEENVEITEDGVHLRGQGKAIVGSTGKTFGGDAYPVIDGNVAGMNAPSLRVAANNVSVRGFDFTHSPGGANPGNLDSVFGSYVIDRAGVLAENANNLYLLCNNFYFDNTYGALILADGIEDFQVTLEKNDARDNSSDGVRIHGVGASGSFSALIEGNVLNGNVDNGMSLLALNYDEVELLLQNNSFSGNGLGGFAADLNGLDGVLFEGLNNQANGNALYGFSLAALSANGLVIGQLRDMVAHNNVGGDGVTLNLTGNNGVFFGALAPFVSTLDGATIYANNNAGGHGLSLQAGSAAGLVISLIDEVIANDNFANGVNLQLTSEGSAISSMINAQANDNGANGLLLSLNSLNDSAVQTIADMEASGNTGHGLSLLLSGINGGASAIIGNPLSAFSPQLVGTGMAIADDNGGFGMQILAAGESSTLWLGKGRANDNGLGGIQYLGTATTGDATVLMGHTFNPGVGLLPGFVQANDNSGSGIEISAISASGETTVMLGATEANNNTLHGINVLGLGDQEVVLGFGVVNLPGGAFDPLFGGITANDNQIFGISFSAQSINSSASVLMHNVTANDNGIGGINGQASALENLLVLLGGNLFGGQSSPWPGIQANGNQAASGITLLLNSGSDDITVVGGGIQANDNFLHGIDLFANADQDLTVILGIEQGSGGGLQGALVQADNNLNGSGLHLGGVSTSGEIIFALPEFQFDGNALFGLNAILAAGGAEDVTVLLGILDAPDFPAGLEGSGSASGNLAGSGINLSVSSLGGDDFIAIHNVLANDNSLSGINLIASAAGEIGLEVSAVTANNNGNHGINALLNADETITALFNGVEAVSNAIHGISFLPDSSASGVSATFSNVNVSHNTNVGLLADIEADGPIMVDMANVTASDNDLSGILLFADSQNNEVIVDMVGVRAIGNGEHGALLQLIASTDIEVMGRNNEFRNNTIHGLIVNAAFGGFLDLDFGGGFLGGGQNSFTGNGNFGLLNGGAGKVWAQNNFWGNVPPVFGTDFSINVDASNHLLVDPNP